MGEPGPVEANLRTYLRVVRRRYKWIVIVTLLAVAVGAAISLTEQKKYTAAAQLLVKPAGATSSLISGTQQTVSPTDILTELQLLSSPPVKEKATKILGFQPSISASQIGQTNVISIMATASSASLAAKAANVYASVFTSEQQTDAIDALILGEQKYQDQIDAIDAQIQALNSSASSTASSTISALAGQEAVLKGDEAQLEVAAVETPGGVEVVSSARPPLSSSSPRPVRNGAIALIIGLLLGLGVAFVVDYFDDRIHDEEELARLGGGVPVLALIPNVRGWKKRNQAKLMAVEDPSSPVTESYRALGASLQAAEIGGSLNTILITSADAVVGRSSTAANLGVVLANSGKQVVVVGCDFRRPRLDQFFGLPIGPGFASVLIGNEQLMDVVRPVQYVPGLALLGSGPNPRNAVELLGSSRSAQVLRELASSFDVVLMDSPPLLVADTLVLAKYADATLVVVAMGKTRTKQLEQAMESLGRVNAHVAGIVLNKVSRGSDDVSNYGYGYGDQSPPRENHAASRNKRAKSSEPAPMAHIGDQSPEQTMVVELS